MAKGKGGSHRPHRSLTPPSHSPTLVHGRCNAEDFPKEFSCSLDSELLKSLT